MAPKTKPQTPSPRRGSAPSTPTSSPRAAKSAPGRKRTRTAHKPLKPFTLDHFRAYARLLILDNGEPWEIEDFQAAVIEDVFAGATQTWLVVPEGNGKTTTMGGLALYHADYTPTAKVLLAAASRDQCGLLLGQASGFIYRSPGMTDRFRVFEGYRRIVALRTEGRIQVYAADDRTGDGEIPTLALLDELHRHRDMRLYRTWLGKLDKRNGQLVAISTAGEPGSEFEDTRHRALTAGKAVHKNQYTRAVNGTLVIHDYALRPGQDVEDLKLVKKANPFSGVTVAKLKRKRDSPTMTHAHWSRFTCNVATSVEESAIPPIDWAACAEDDVEIPPGCEVLLGLDLGWKWDTTALVPLWWESPTRRVVGKPTILTPPRDGTLLEERLIVDALEQACDTWDVQAVVLDPNAGGEQLAQRISDELGVPFVEHSQRITPMALAASRLLEAVRNRHIVHPNDPDLNAHVLAARAKQLPGGDWRMVKNRDYIDACIALAMVNSVAVGEEMAPAAPTPFAISSEGVRSW